MTAAVVTARQQRRQLLAVAGLACFARGVKIRAERAAWLTMGVGVVGWAFGNVCSRQARAPKTTAPKGAVATPEEKVYDPSSDVIDRITGSAAPAPK